MTPKTILPCRLGIVSCLLLLLQLIPIGAWQQQQQPQQRNSLSRPIQPFHSFNEQPESHSSSISSSPLLALTQRRNVLQRFGWIAAAVITTTTTTTSASPANALIKGNTPPPKKPSASMEKLKCTNIDECIALGEKQQAELEKADSENAMASPPLTTPKGVKYRDVSPGTGNAQIKNGDQVTLAYKVLKLGKRSYDGLSGEGTVIFSRGYGLEDDEEKVGDTSWTTTVGQMNNIIAMEEALVDMKVNGIRRFTVMPQLGWERPTRACDGGPGGRGPGGDVKVDYVVVPSATMVATEACLDNTRQPFPTTYAQQRRMAQRFDQSLLMEVQVLGINNKKTLDDNDE